MVKGLGKVFTAGAVIDAVWGLVAGEATGRTFGTGVEPVAVGVEFGFDKIFVDFDGIFFGEGFCERPSGGFFFEAVDVGGEGLVF